MLTVLLGLDDEWEGSIDRDIKEAGFISLN